MPRPASAIYCEKEAAPPGSNLYYCLLYYSPATRQKLIAWHALASELDQIQWECSDLSVARLKYAWWHEELERFEYGSPRHPVTQELQKVLDSHPELAEEALRITQDYEMRLSCGVMAESAASSLDKITEGSGRIWQMSARLCHASDPTIEVLMKKAGTLFELFHLLQHQPITTHPYQEERIEPHHMTIDPSNRINYFKEVLEELDNFLISFPRDKTRSLIHVLIMARLLRATGREIARDGYQLESHQISLTPIRKLLISKWTKIKYS